MYSIKYIKKYWAHSLFRSLFKNIQWIVFSRVFFTFNSYQFNRFHSILFSFRLFRKFFFLWFFEVSSRKQLKHLHAKLSFKKQWIAIVDDWAIKKKTRNSNSRRTRAQVKRLRYLCYYQDTAVMTAGQRSQSYVVPIRKKSNSSCIHENIHVVYR